VAHDPYLEEGAFREMGTEPLSLEETLKQSDVLSLHTPLTAETHHLLNAERLSLMKPTSILINTARGKIVDTVALAEALKNCQLGAAGIDVFEEEPLPEDHPLRTSPNTLLSPHWAWHSTESELRLHKMGAEEALRGLRGETLRSRINF
jgi:D-3-phosphoglycerate dehydrogenase